MYLQYLNEKNEPKIAANLDQYVDLIVTQNTYVWVFDNKTGKYSFAKDKKRTPMKICPQGRIGTGPDSVDYLGVNKYYYCPDESFNYTLQGSFSAQTASFIEIAVRKCN